MQQGVQATSLTSSEWELLLRALRTERLAHGGCVMYVSVLCDRMLHISQARRWWWLLSRARRCQRRRRRHSHVAVHRQDCIRLGIASCVLFVVV
jgi:hypothetical protein